MERPRRHLVPLLLLLGAVLAGAGATVADAQQACEPTNLATQIALFCAPDMPTAPCCEPVVASVDLGGGVPCLCRVAAQPQLVLARLNASHLLSLYTACGGLRPGGSHLAAVCQGPSPPAVPVIAPPPPPAPRHKRDTAPPPPPSEKPSPPPQQQPGRGKAAIPTSPAVSYAPMAPAAAPAAPITPPSSGSDGGRRRYSAATLFIFFAAILIILD